MVFLCLIFKWSQSEGEKKIKIERKQKFSLQLMDLCSWENRLLSFFFVKFFSNLLWDTRNCMIEWNLTHIDNITNWARNPKWCDALSVFFFWKIMIIPHAEQQPYHSVYVCYLFLLQQARTLKIINDDDDDDVMLFGDNEG